MPTYIYSPSQKSNQKSKTNNYTSSPNKKSQNLNLLRNFSKVQNNESKTIRYQTTAPSFVNKRYVKRSNGGYTLEYKIQNAKIVDNKKPKLRFIQIAKLISPKKLE